MRGLAAVATLLASATGALAGQFKIHNYLGQPIYYWINNNGGNAVVIPPGGVNIPPAGAVGASMSIKIAKVNDNSAPYTNRIMQFEFTNEGSNGYWYDVSLINGSPFSGDNIKVTPTGTGAGTNNCLTVRCAANQKCIDAYLKPDDNQATHICPAGAGDLWLDIGIPAAQLNARQLEFNA